MFFNIASFEFRYQLKSPVLWITFVVFFLLTFGSVTIDQIQIGARGNIHINAPFAIAQSVGIMAILAQFAVVAFVANIVLRDSETGFGPILYATRLTKFDYLFGRFVGAFGACMIILASVPLALYIGAHMPWLDHERLGPFVTWHYVFAYLFAGLPTIFLCACMFFALATATRSMMATYVGLMAFFVLYVTLSNLFSRPEFETAVTLFEPYGLGALFEQTKYWTASDRNTMLPPIGGKYLANRAIWGAVSIAGLAAAYMLFSFSAKGVKRARSKFREIPAPGHIPAEAPVSRRSFGAGAAWAQLLSRTRFEFDYVLKSPAFLVLLSIGLLNAYGGLWFADEFNGTPIYPVTRVMAQTLFGAFTLFPMIIATYYAGELVWRDREKRVHEIVDATPAPDWTFVAPKVLALMLVLVASILVSVLAGAFVQVLKGYTNYQWHEYMNWYVVPASIFALQLAALAILLQALSPHKFIGWGLMLLYLIATITLGQIGFDHDLYLYAGTPATPLSELNDHDHYWIGAAWFRAYWTTIALIFVLIAYTLWRRGTETRLMPRLAALPRRLKGVTGVLALALVLIAGGLGGWIFYNTNVLNTYESRTAGEKWAADMERALLRYETAPQPKITDVTLNVELHPHQHAATTTGAYTIVNRTNAPLGEIHLFWPRRLELMRVEVDGATLADDFATHTPSFPFQIWRLSTPMQPGETRHIRFTTRDRLLGFRDSDVLQRINDNGTFINDTEISPILGFPRRVLLQDRNVRRRQHLPSELRVPRLEDENARNFNYIRHDSDWVMADITVSTDADQIPIAPGYVVSDETRNGRRTTHFRTDSPIMHFFSVQSARYSVRRARWHDVDLAVYYDQRHAYNVDRMLRAMQVSLDTFSTEFSPFQFRQMRILEFPAYASFAQSFANTVPYSEQIGFIARFDDADTARETDKIDNVTYITAHEVGHQWWAHQIIGSEQQGMTMLSETFAQYSALLVMERLYGPDQVRRFLKFELDRYLRARGSEVIEELPLMRVENQGYIHYNKGGLIMYFLRNEIGEAAVNRSLRRLLQEFAFKGAPYPRSSDFIRILREEAGPAHQDLITDLFERITLYDAKVVEASTQRRADGRWDVTMTVEAHKFYANGQGHETEQPLNEDFEVGVFTAEPGRGAFAAHDVVVFERRPIHTGRQTITLTVDRQPRFIGVDPYNKRIDRNADDNVMAVTQPGGATTTRS